MKRKRVGLIILSEIPEIGLVAILRERGWFNLETMKPETWPGVCQVTVHGRLEPGEDTKTAILRELTEELGEDFAFHIASLIAIDADAIHKVSDIEISPDKIVTTYAMMIEYSLLKKIRLAPDSGAIRIVSLSEIDKIVEATSDDQAICLENRGIIKMHSDEKVAIVSAFDLALVPSQ